MYLRQEARKARRGCRRSCPTRKPPSVGPSGCQTLLFLVLLNCSSQLPGLASIPRVEGATASSFPAPLPEKYNRLPMRPSKSSASQTREETGGGASSDDEEVSSEELEDHPDELGEREILWTPNLVPKNSSERDASSKELDLKKTASNASQGIHAETANPDTNEGSTFSQSSVAAKVEAKAPETVEDDQSPPLQATNTYATKVSTIQSD